MEEESPKIGWVQSLFLRKPLRDGAMDAYIINLVKELRVGRILSVQRYSFLSRKIRASLTFYIRRLARLAGDPDWHKWEVWSSHQGLIVQDASSAEWGVAESIPKGAVVTPWSAYERDIRSGACKVRVYEVMDAPSTAGVQAQSNWYATVKGHVYDWLAYFRLLIKNLLIDFSDINPSNKFKQWLKWFGDKAAGWEWANWCTEGVGESYIDDPPKIDIYQTKNPTPATHEQVAGELPRKAGKKTTLRRIEIPA